jgi:PKD repeat protein
MVTYDTPGRYDVTLVAWNTIGTSTADSIEMIIVGAPTANFSVSEDYLASGETTDFTDESSGSPTSWLWTFEGGTPETSTDQNPTGIQYNTQGAFDVTLEATNDYGSNTYVEEDFITVDGPFADFEADNTYIEPGQSVTFTDMSINSPDSWSWKFFGGNPGAHSGQTPPAITYNGQGAFNVKLTVSNDLGSNAITKVDYINVGNVRVDEETFDDMLNIYPNPTQGSFTLDVGPHGLGDVQLIIRDTKGEVVHQEIIDGRTEKINVDLSDHAAGIYLLSVQSGDIKVDRKVTLLK